MQAYNGWQLYEHELLEPLLKFGDPRIDHLLQGGLRKGITEISGEAGSGKTSFGMQLLFQCGLKVEDGGLNAKAVYISTEGRLHPRRYQQIHDYYSQKYQDIDFGSKILMMDVKKLSTQEDSLFNLLPEAAELNNVKLIVLDSIATFYRKKTNYIQRAKEMNKTCQHLTKLSNQHNMIVVLINQVTDVFPSDSLFSTLCAGSLLSSCRKIKASLGLAWSNIIDTRIMLSRHSLSHDIKSVDTENNETYLQGSTSKVIRQLHIIFSPYLAKRWVNFEINEHGIKGLLPNEIRVEKKEEAPKETGAVQDIFDDISDSQMLKLWSQIPDSVNLNNTNNNNNNNNEIVSSCSPTQILRTMSSGSVEEDDSDVEILNN